MSGRRVAITGGGSGIGAQTAHRLSCGGVDVALLDLDAKAAAAVAAELEGVTAIGIGCDVRDAASVKEAIDAAAEALGGLDGVVASAGIVDPVPIESMSDESWLRMLDIHLGGTFRAARAAFPYLREAGGAIVALSSIAAHTPIALRSSYASAKGGIEGLTRNLAVEWAGHGIRMNAVAPGYVDTPMMRKSIESGALDEEGVKERIARVPLGRLARAEEIAAAIAFLLGDESSFITGQVLFVDGGITINGTYGI